MTRSAIYTGTIRHRRFEPSPHEFTYPIFMMYLDLDELPSLFSKHWFTSIDAFNLVSFKRSDYFKPEVASLKTALVKEFDLHTGLGGNVSAVRALMHVRYLNYVFNPVVMYYFYDAAEQPLGVLAEITNTPWGERHHYVLPFVQVKSASSFESSPHHEVRGKDKHQFVFDKRFHVSPFNPMEMKYRWVFSEPNERLHIHMDNFLKNHGNAQDNALGHALEKTSKHFDSTLTLERKEFERHLSSTLIRYPFMTVKVATGIYWQALKLWLKKAPFYDHPEANSQLFK